MYKVKDIISRADEVTVEKILGKQLVLLVQKLDKQYVKTNELKKLIFHINEERKFLDNKKFREILIDLLRVEEIKLLAETLGYLNSKGINEYVFLKNKKIISKSEDELIFYNFFDVKVPQFKNEFELQVGNQETIDPRYKLFPHQRRAVKELIEVLNKYPHRVLLHMPTGSGKTRTTMDLLCSYLRDNEHTVVIWLASTDELCNQAYIEFKKAWSYLGNRRINISGLWGNTDNKEVYHLNDGFIVAGFQKLTQFLRTHDGLKLLSKLASKISFIIVDEAHQSVAEKYQSVIEILFNSKHSTKLLGLSATPGRTWNDIEEDQKLADFYNSKKVTLSIENYNNPVEYLIDKEYIASVKYKNLIYSNINNQLDQSIFYNLNSKKDYSKEVLSILGQDSERNIQIIEQVINLSQIHKRIIVFAPSVESSEVIATILKIKGFLANSITSNTELEVRRTVIDKFRRDSDEISIICNYGVLTTGFDSPNISAAVIARPTLSLVLYSQMVGRAIRGKKAGGNSVAEIVTVVDTELPGFRSVADSFYNWEDVWDD
ncbi:DEAD/DEAH box helicase [Neobacillus novalis]|uniref:DEAD/DEAH box helicase n=1 Tax=Neobacillus novalis TaxID=220687 RepID=A0AA95SEV1_9BACI|nr:DEAD/DEAH box helicase [Neobacillus novalis]WHY88588.1 DEAD/DEAH box helicase [Neobacillus novalis]